MIQSAITLALLAGGEGSRMGKPKGALTVQGVPLAEYVHRRIAWPGPTLLVTAPGREHPSGSAAFDREVTDPESGLGPLRGMLTALEATTTPLLLVTAVDMPRVGAMPLTWLANQLEPTPDAAGLLLTRSGQIEPLPCAFRTAIATGPVRELLGAGRRSVRSVLDRQGFTTVEAPSHWPPDVWTNLNFPADWDAFVRDATNRPDRDY